MRRTSFVWALGLSTLPLACGNDTTPDPPANQNANALTYYDDMLPLFEQHCLQCHQDGGIAPFRLDQYGEAKRRAGEILDETSARAMPPWSATSDGSCQQFSHSLALSDDELGTIKSWVEGGALEGTPRAVEIPVLPTLGHALELSTPAFSPVAQGGELAEFDEYRCFLLDTHVGDVAFITGYDVVPGTPDVIHHVLGMVVEPDAPSELDGQTNGALMAALDAESPDRDGWPCFGMAGDGVQVKSVPVIWAPGQGVVEYPGESGVPLLPSDRVVVQVHYNLAGNPGALTDTSMVRLRLAPHVENVGAFVLDDPLLATLRDDVPHALEPGQKSVKYTWTRDLKDYFEDLPNVQLFGLMPHMHQRGHSYRMSFGTGNDLGCAMDVPAWDFHWQRMYFYAQPIAVTPTSRLEVTCDYDTSADTEPVLPGWGTRNEMCLATMYFVVPASQLGF